jgi:hypothetical protein
LAYYSASDWQHYRSTRKIISPPASPGPAKSALQPAEEGPLNRVNPGSANADQQANLHAIMRFEDGISSQSSQDEGNVSQDHHLQQQPPMRQSMPAILDERLTTAPLGSTDPFAFYRVLGVERLTPLSLRLMPSTKNWRFSIIPTSTTLPNMKYGLINFRP